jgi:hypothetical protein
LRFVVGLSQDSTASLRLSEVEAENLLSPELFARA